jgi:hypothetical protein
MALVIANGRESAARTAAPWSLIAEVAHGEAILIVQDRDQCAARLNIAINNWEMYKGKSTTCL